MRLDEQDKSVSNIVPVIEQLDPMVLNSVHQIANLSKSTSLALMLIYQPQLSLKDAIKIARVDEQHQQSVFGSVEGAHDIDEALMSAQFHAARQLVLLAL